MAFVAARWLLHTTATIALAVALAPGVATASGAHRPVTVCYVSHAAPEHEHTIRVSPHAVDALIRRSLSYRGACAAYGEATRLGDGTLSVYSQAERGVPTAIGVRLGDGALDGLPYEPATAGLWCYDRNGDGTTDQNHECSGGYEHALQLSQDFKAQVDSPFTYVLVNWNPMGHTPPGIYDVPHFDIHFYLEDNAARLAIRPGPCPMLVNCDDYAIGKIAPDAKYVAPGYVDVDAVEPAMGNHLIDVTGPEFGGRPFTHSFIYGIWAGRITFYEPMVTHKWFAGLRAGVIDDSCFAIKAPAAWQRSGWYPTRYCLRHRANRHELTASLEGFAYRQAA